MGQLEGQGQSNGSGQYGEEQAVGGGRGDSYDADAYGDVQDQVSYSGQPVHN